MKLTDSQKRFAKSLAIYTLVYPLAMQVVHRIRTGSFDWSDFRVSFLTALVLGVLFFVVGTYVPTKDE